MTATKTGDTIRTLPLSAQVQLGPSLERFGPVPGTQAVAQLADGLVLSNLGPGRNKSFLRGVADSPFNGVTQATVAVEVDDARVTFNAPDPELRLVDIDRVELLEGPQGPMHGTGALGGVYRIVPRVARADRIEAALSIGADVVSHGGLGESASAMLNLPLVGDTLALRAVGYGAHEPGWIEREGAGGHDSNTSQEAGGRASVRWLPASGLSIELSGILQMLHVDDSQYVNDGGKPFERSGVVAEPHDNDFKHARLAVHDDLGWAHLSSTTSWTRHEVDSVLDASAAAGLFGQAAPLRFEDSRQYGVRSQELRLSGGERWRWLGGLSWLRATTRLDATVSSPGRPDGAVGSLRQSNSELATFGQVSFPVVRRLRLDLGGRLFHTSTQDVAAGSRTTLKSTQHTSFSPSASLGWSINDLQFVFVRFASAYRPAGLSPFAPADAQDFESDELQSAELGGRFRAADGRLSINATGYLSNWSHIQSDYLLPNCLVATRNSGTGQIYGLEADVAWSDGRLRLISGLTVQHARLEKPQPGLPIPSDLSLPVVPAVKAHVGADLSGALGRGAYRVGTKLSYVGPARLSLDPTLNRRIDDRTTLEMDAGYSRGNWALSIRGDNLLNSRADTFAFGNPFSIAATRQKTPQSPRSVRLTLSKTW